MFKTSLQASFMVASLVLTSPCRFPLQRSVREASCGVPCRHTKRLYISRSSKIAQTNSPQIWVLQRSVWSCHSQHMPPWLCSEPGLQSAAGLAIPLPVENSKVTKMVNWASRVEQVASSFHLYLSGQFIVQLTGYPCLFHFEQWKAALTFLCCQKMSWALKEVGDWQV